VRGEGQGRGGKKKDGPSTQKKLRSVNRKGAVVRKEGLEELGD
jgi:hypothetical protein